MKFWVSDQPFGAPNIMISFTSFTSRVSLKKIVASILMIATLSALSACDPNDVAKIASSISAEDSASDVSIVNSLPYSFGDSDTAVRAFVIVARHRGWQDQDIQKWIPFAAAIMNRESGNCPLVRRGVKLANNGLNCEIAKQGKHSDSGIGQIIAGYPFKGSWVRPVNGGSWGLYENAAWLCPQENLCSPDEIIASPWTSFTAFVAMIERAGSSPYCYTAKLRRTATCRNAP
jgi:hypothetical protein